MNKIKNFVFQRSFIEAIEELPDEVKKDFTWAIVKYVYYNEEPIFKGILKVAWVLVKPVLDKSKNKSKNARKQKQI